LAGTGRSSSVPASFSWRLRERVGLPRQSRLAARVEGRNSLARLGLAVHLTAPTIHAGFSGNITLEITNQGPIPIKLRPGLAICQLVLEHVFGTPAREMTGIFQDQDSTAGRLRG
jgi:dCTP deaminase